MSLHGQTIVSILGTLLRIGTFKNLLNIIFSLLINMTHLLLILCRAESSHAQLKRQLGSSQGNFEAVWTKIHSLSELQHTSIRSSFEKSKTIVQHNFKPAEYKELRGNISKNALEKIFTEAKRANLVGINASVCGCVIRRTHGLPCAPESNESKIKIMT